MKALLNDPEQKINGFILPGHVCTITGRNAFDFISSDYRLPAVIGGFEEADTMAAYLREQWGAGRASIIGRVTEGKGDLYLKTDLGGTRRLQMLAGAPLPRIC